MSTDRRHPIFALSDRFVDEVASLSPTTATSLGIAGHDHRWDDTSPAGARAIADHRRATLAEVATLEPAVGDLDRLAVRILEEEIALELDALDHGDHLRDVGHLTGLFPRLRDVFELMDTSTPEGWDAVIERLGTIGRPLAGWRASLQEGMDRGLWAGRRQAESMVEQLRASVAPDGSLVGLVERGEQDPVAARRLDRLRHALAEASEAVVETARWIEEHYLPRADETDAVGRERYARHSRSFLGADIDFEETYRWGWDHLLELWDEMEGLARRIDPKRSLPEVVELLETDPARGAATQEEFRRAMLERSRRALADLDGTHFDIPAEIKEIDVRLAPLGAALGAYYIPPSEDFSRPGTTWWSLGDKAPVPLWAEITTAYHEGFPGHHLQCGIQVCLGDRLSRVHRLLFWLSGYGEGWALYAERLMRELGYFDRPEYELGMVAGNALRAVRVAVDIGSHLDLPIPADVPFHPGERWTYDLAVEALRHYAFLDDANARSEVTRYLGWPAQAISYKVGERAILRLRDEVRARDGDRFDLKAFHERVLGSGPVGLDHLRELVLA